MMSAIATQVHASGWQPDSATALRRMRNQLLAGTPARTPHEAVRRLGAVQAQDYLASLWAVGLRTRACSEGDVERAVAGRRIVRCWPMRGTIHFVAAEDARWMIHLLAPRALARHRTRLERDFGLDPPALRRCARVVERELRDGGVLTRGEIYEALERARIETGAGRGMQIVHALAHMEILCFGPRRERQPTFVLMDEWLPPAAPKEREAALAEIALRYTASHGPATPSDLAWWTGLSVTEAARAIAVAGDPLRNAPPPRRPAAGAHLLPPFDEYLVGYRHRSAVLDPAHAADINAGGGLLAGTILLGGVISGTWKRRLVRGAVEVSLSPFRALRGSERHEVEEAALRYAAFLGVPLSRRADEPAQR